MNQFVEFIYGLPLAAILGILIAAILGYWLAQARDKQNRLASIWNSECLLFRAAFHDTMTDLHDIDEAYSIAAILRRRFRSHQSAYDRFILHVPGDTKRDLDEAWKEYKKYHLENEELGLRVSGRDVPEARQRDIVVGHINRLLSFAKET